MSAIEGIAPAELAAGVDRAARLLGVDPAAAWAVFEVECAGAPFLPDGRPTVLFEAHIFSRKTGGRFDRTHPNLSSPTWDRTLYGATGAHQWERLDAAAALDRPAALESASWGAFQIMGFNHVACGFMTVEAFVDCMRAGFAGHVEAFVGFVRSVGGLADKLRARDWAEFARVYNGPGYRQNRYDEKLAAAYLRGLWREVQRGINARRRRAFLTVDGRIGPATLDAWRALGLGPLPDSPRIALKALGRMAPAETPPAEPPKGANVMSVKAISKAIAAFVGGFLVAAASQYFGVEVPAELQDQVVQTFGLDETLKSIGGGLATAVLTFFAPKNAEPKGA